MSKLVAQFDPSTGSGSFQAGAVNRCSTLWVMNESPNFIKLDFSAADTPKIVQPWYNKKLTLTNPVQTVNWSVMATLQADSPPVSLVFVELYDPSEDTSALLSGPLQRQTNVGNTVNVNSNAGTTFEQDLVTPCVMSGLTSSVQGGNLLQIQAGIAFLRQADSSVTRVATSLQQLVRPGVPNATLFVDLNPDGTFSVGTTHSTQPNYLTICTVTTNALGLPVSVTDARILATTLLAGIQEIDLGSAVTGMQAPPKLLATYQETGYASGAGVAAAGGNAWAFPVNFKTVLTNVPSSITLNGTSGPSNCSVAANNISKYGFSLVLTATAAGSFFWVGSYTTVGN